MIKVLTSAPASGKTEYCIARLREVLEQKNPVNIWVLVPQFQRLLSLALHKFPKLV